MSAFFPMRFACLLLAAWCLVPAPQGFAAGVRERSSSRLIPVFHSKRIWNGVATAADGRVFVCFAGVEGEGMQLAEMTARGKAVPYPTADWNAWKPGGDVRHAFVHVNALRFDPDGSLWVVDAGAPGLGQPQVAGAARLIQIDVQAGRVARVYDLGAGVKPSSYVDDVRFHGGLAYLTDAGAPGLLVLDLNAGSVRRVLDGVPAATDLAPLRADGKILRDAAGKEIRVHADQLEVSPDGRWLYFQPASGPLARIETRWMDDASVSPSALAGRVEEWVRTPTTGGTAIDAAGNIYLSDTDRRRILRIAPDRTVTTLVADPRLVWADALWIDRHGFLWIPAAQLNRTPGLNGGKGEVVYPVWIYKMQIGARPPATDHQ